jgi:hypothetical protein
MSKRETDRFKCTDAEGNIYTVIERTNIITIPGIQGEAKGTTGFELSDGKSVDEIDVDGIKKFKIVQTDIVIWKV